VRPLRELIGEGVRVASFVGAGGKTSLIRAIAAQVSGWGAKVVVTTTTKIMPPSRNLLLLDAAPRVPPYRVLTVGRRVDAETGKLLGVDPADMADILERFRPGLLLVEADGARGRSIKAPAEHEPVIPADSDLVVGVMGLDALGQPASERTVFRLAEFCRVTGLAPGQPIGPEAFAALVAHPEGLFKGAPAGARRIAFHNKAEAHPFTGAVYGSAKLGWFMGEA
jgi:probable selenium-dependent hydroxylase accessory protein YqeC